MSHFKQSCFEMEPLATYKFFYSSAEKNYSLDEEVLSVFSESVIQLQIIAFFRTLIHYITRTKCFKKLRMRIEMIEVVLHYAELDN